MKHFTTTFVKNTCKFLTILLQQKLAPLITDTDKLVSPHKAGLVKKRRERLTDLT